MRQHLFGWQVPLTHVYRKLTLYPPPGSGTDSDAQRLMDAGEKISAIKLYRELHNVDLKTAKEAVEALGRARRPGASAVEAPEDPARCAPVSTITV